MYYMAQFETGPPRFAVQVNDRAPRDPLLRLLPREPAARTAGSSTACRSSSTSRARTASDRRRGVRPRRGAARVRAGLEPRRRRSWCDERGGRWSERAPRDMMGMSSPEWSRYVRDELGVALDPGEISADVVARLERIYRERLPWIEGAREAVERLSPALAARPRLLFQPGDHRPLPGALRARGPLRGDGVVRGGGAREARARRVPGGGTPARGGARRLHRGRGLRERDPGGQGGRRCG